MDITSLLDWRLCLYKIVQHFRIAQSSYLTLPSRQRLEIVNLSPPPSERNMQISPSVEVVLLTTSKVNTGLVNYVTNAQPKEPLIGSFCMFISHVSKKGRGVVLGWIGASQTDCMQALPRYGQASAARHPRYRHTPSGSSTVPIHGSAIPEISGLPKIRVLSLAFINTYKRPDYRDYVLGSLSASSHHLGLFFQQLEPHKWCRKCLIEIKHVNQ